MRQRRKLLQLSLKTVAAGAGITESYLSQIERDRASGSVAVLQRITRVLRMTLGELFDDSDSEEATLQRYSVTRNLQFGRGGRKFRVTPTTFAQLEVLLGEFEPGGTTGDDPYTHGDSEETLTVIEGTVSVTLGAEEFELGRFDSLRYRSSVPHRVREKTGTSPAIILWAMSPPTY